MHRATNSHGKSVAANSFPQAGDEDGVESTQSTPESMQSVIQHVLIIVYFYYFSRNKVKDVRVCRKKMVQHCLFNPFLLLILYHMDLFFSSFRSQIFGLKAPLITPSFRNQLNIQQVVCWRAQAVLFYAIFLPLTKPVAKEGAGERTGRRNYTEKQYVQTHPHSRGCKPWGSGMEIDVRAKPTS